MTITNPSEELDFMRDEIYFKVMRLLQESPDLTQRQLAQALGVSVGSMNYCLKALAEKGWVKMKNFANSRNKFGYAYLLTLSGIKKKTEMTSSFLARKVVEYELLRNEIEALRSEAASEIVNSLDSAK